MGLGPEQTILNRIKMAQKCLKNFSLSLAIIREKQMKPTVEFHVITVRIVRINKQTTKDSGEHVGGEGAPLQCWRDLKLTQPL